MNSKEPFDLAKMAITLLLVCLVVGATIGFFYMLYDNTDQRINNMEKATQSASMERIYDLAQQFDANAGDIDNYPLVTNVVSAITEFQESDLLYITIDTRQGGISHANAADVVTFTYTDITLSSSVPGTHLRSQTPVTDASRLLLPYSHCRCEVRIFRYDTDTGSVADGFTTTAGMTGISITPLPTRLGGS